MEQWAVLENKITLKYHVKHNALNPPPIPGETEYRETLLLKDCPRGEPLWDLARTGPSCSVVDHKRELEIHEQFLSELREKEAILSHKFKKDYEELLTAEANLRTHFLKFNRFVKENKEKTDRAKRKLETEGDVHIVLQADVDELRTQVDFYEKIKACLRKNIDKYFIYERYLQDVVDISANLHSPIDTYKRYEALTSARHEISIAQQKNMQALEETIRAKNLLLSEKKMKMIGLNNELASLDRRYAVLQGRTFRRETTVVRTKDYVYDKESEIYIVRDLFWDMYNELLKRRHQTREQHVPVDRLDMEGQLKFIQASINELRLVVDKARELDREERVQALEEAATEQAIQIAFEAATPVETDEVEEEDQNEPAY